MSKLMTRDKLLAEAEAWAATAEWRRQRWSGWADHLADQG